MNTRIEMTEIGLLIYPGAQLAAVHGLTDLFNVANRMLAQHAATERPTLRVSHWRAQSEGREIECVFDSHPTLASHPTVVIVPPSLADLPSSETTLSYTRWLRQCHAAGATLGSVCVGAFLLAETGLLAGRAATTHWSFAQTLGERFPDIRVEADKPIIDDGDIITTGGLMAWADLGLRLVERLLGPTIALETARFLVVDSSGQTQRYYNNFSPTLNHGDEAVLRVQHWLQATGARAVTVAAMAAQAGLEERTFLRRFRAATGLKPTEYCQQLRVGKAREMLEFTHRTIDQIAWEVGYQDPGAFRKVFRKLAGLSPSDYRRRFSASTISQQSAPAPLSPS